MRFKGKIAVWWYAMGVFMIACTLWFLISGMVGIANFSPDAIVSIVGAIIFVLSDISIIDSCLRNFVDFHEDFLIVRLSVLTETIPYSKITCIKETNSVWASLSTSLDRLQIDYNSYDIILIAVKDKEGFLAEIIKRNPRIRVERKTARIVK